jgi:benzoyl-CoA reductase/2-hydroxyglutaryl-CoA dehydratase subunit BcrC/BadD/HgdB
MVTVVNNRRHFMEEDRLTMHLKERPAQLEEAKKKGTKIVGYFPGNYVPEELIYASGAIPLCLIEGGSNLPVEAASSVLPHIACPFVQAQAGEMILKKNPYYRMIDMVVAPITCQHLKKVAEIWDYNGDIEVFKLGIPHRYDGDLELDYFMNRLVALKDRLERLTGNKITNDKIGGAIELYNRMRELFKKISLTRCSSSPPISGLDFVKLNHASFYADSNVMVDVLDTIYQKLSKRDQDNTVEAPRLLLIGPNIGNGDYGILELVESAGGKVVVEEVCEGTRYYWQSIDNKGDSLRSLAKGYLQERLPCAFMRYASKKRLDFALKLVTNFKVSGIIWYELLYCETYDSESYFFAQKMGERNIPMLKLESEYGTASVGQFKVRIDAFIELVKGGIK